VGTKLKIEAVLRVGTVGGFVTGTTDVKAMEKASQRADATPYSFGPSAC